MPVLISYGVFEFHSGIQDAAGHRTFSFLLSHAQLTTATRYTLSYICGCSLTFIYTRREEIPEEPSGDKIKIAVPPEVLSEEHSKRNRTYDVRNWWAYPSPHARSTCTRQMMPTTCKRIMRFCEQERPWPTQPLVLEKFAFELSRSCRHIYISIFTMINSHQSCFWEHMQCSVLLNSAADKTKEKWKTKR